MKMFRTPEVLTEPGGATGNVDPGPPATLKKYLIWFTKLGLTCLLLWLALRQVPMKGLGAAFLSANPALALASVILFLAGIIPAETSRFLGAGGLLAERQPGFARWLRIYLQGRPFFYLLPAAVGAEGIIWIRLRGYQWRHASCGFTVLLTRLFGVGAWALAAGISLAAPGGAGAILSGLPPWLGRPGLWVGLGILVIGASAVAPWFMGRFRGLPMAGGRWRTLAFITCATGASLLLSTLAASLAGLATGTPFGFVAIAGLLALFNFAMVLPISLGGFGLQEALVLRLGLPLGFSASHLLVFSALLHLQRVMLALVGGLIFLKGEPADVAIRQA